MGEKKSKLRGIVFSTFLHLSFLNVTMSHALAKLNAVLAKVEGSNNANNDNEHPEDEEMKDVEPVQIPPQLNIPIIHKGQLPSKDIKGLAAYIRSPHCKKIAILAGAGISVSAGIPDFRSKGGFYDTLDPTTYQLTPEQFKWVKEDPQHLLTIELFRQNQVPYLQARYP